MIGAGRQFRDLFELLGQVFGIGHASSFVACEQSRFMMDQCIHDIFDNARAGLDAVKRKSHHPGIAQDHGIFQFLMDVFFAFDLVLSINSHGTWLLIFLDRSFIDQTIEHLFRRTEDQTGLFFFTRPNDRLGRFHIDLMRQIGVFFTKSRRRIGCRMETKIKILTRNKVINRLRITEVGILAGHLDPVKLVLILTHDITGQISIGSGY